MPGNPDWQKVTQWQGSNLFALPQSVFTVGDNFGNVTPVTTWSAISVQVKPSSGWGTVTVQWWNESNTLNLVRADTWGVNATCGLSVILPTFGPYVRVKVTVTSPGNMTALTQLRGVNNAGMGISYPITQSYIAITGKSVPANGTDINLMPWIRKGPAFVYFAPGDTSGKLQALVEVANPDSTLKTVVLGLGQPTALMSESLIIPDDIVGLHVVNTDAAAAHSYDASLIPT